MCYCKIGCQHSTVNRQFGSLAKSKQIIGGHFQTLFLMFLNIQINFIILKTYDQQFTLTTKKNHCISSLKIIQGCMLNTGTETGAKQRLMQTTMVYQTASVTTILSSNLQVMEIENLFMLVCLKMILTNHEIIIQFNLQ